MAPRLPVVFSFQCVRESQGVCAFVATREADIVILRVGRQKKGANFYPRKPTATCPSRIFQPHFGRHMAGWSVAWLVGWLLCWRALWLLGWMVGGWLVGRIGWLSLIGWLLGWLATGLACLPEWLFDCQVGWLASGGFPIACLIAPQLMQLG